MATKTPFLKLELPANGEYQDTWDSPLNDNLAAIDLFAEQVKTEIISARFGKTSLADFLEVGHEPSGELKPAPEVATARNSKIFGDEDEDEDDLSLKARLDLGDREIWKAREGYENLRSALAARLTAPVSSMILSGKMNGDGYPTWLGFTGANAQVDGSGATPLMLMIEGKICRVRNLEQVEISGASGTKYLYADFEEDGRITVDGDSTTPPPASPNGTTFTDGTKMRLFSDATKDFTGEDVRAGDVLTLLNSNDAGEYLIKEVAPASENDRLKIVGIFPQGALSSIDYSIADPLGVTLGFSTSETPTAGRVYIAEVDFDGANITAVRARHFKDVFIGEWRAVDVSGGSPTFEEIWNHKLGSDLVAVSVQVSQADDGSAPVEELSLAILGNNQIFSFADTLSFNPGTSDASLTGSVTASLTGAYYMERSVFAQWSKNQVLVKNAVSARFYRDYGGVARQVGFIRVIMRRWG